MNYLMYFSEGGQAKVDEGMCFGIETPILKNSCSNICEREGLAVGSSCRMLEMRLLAYLETFTFSGKL